MASFTVCPACLRTKKPYSIPPQNRSKTNDADEMDSTDYSKPYPFQRSELLAGTWTGKRGVCPIEGHIATHMFRRARVVADFISLPCDLVNPEGKGTKHGDKNAWGQKGASTRDPWVGGRQCGFRRRGSGPKRWSSRNQKSGWTLSVCPQTNSCLQARSTETRIRLGAERRVHQGPVGRQGGQSWSSRWSSRNEKFRTQRSDF